MFQHAIRKSPTDGLAPNCWIHSHDLYPAGWLLEPILPGANFAEHKTDHSPVNLCHGRGFGISSAVVTESSFPNLGSIDATDFFI